MLRILPDAAFKSKMTLPVFAKVWIRISNHGCPSVSGNPTCPAWSFQDCARCKSEQEKKSRCRRMRITFRIVGLLHAVLFPSSQGSAHNYPLLGGGKIEMSAPGVGLSGCNKVTHVPNRRRSETGVLSYSSSPRWHGCPFFLFSFRWKTLRASWQHENPLNLENKRIRIRCEGGASNTEKTKSPFAVVPGEQRDPVNVYPYNLSDWMEDPRMELGSAHTHKKRSDSLQLILWHTAETNSSSEKSARESVFCVGRKFRRKKRPSLSVACAFHSSPGPKIEKEWTFLNCTEGKQHCSHGRKNKFGVFFCFHHHRKPMATMVTASSSRDPTYLHNFDWGGDKKKKLHSWKQ